jgi:hypothetical protein
MMLFHYLFTFTLFKNPILIKLSFFLKTLARLERFKVSLSNKVGDTSGSNNKDSGENKNDEDLSGWRSAKLKFVPDPSGKVSSGMNHIMLNIS